MLNFLEVFLFFVFFSHIGRKVISAVYVYCRYEQKNICDDILGSQDPHCVRRKIQKCRMGNSKEEYGLRLKLEVSVQTHDFK